MDLDEILDLERDRYDALRGGDTQALRQLFAENAVWIHSSGRVDDRDALLAAFGTGQIRFLDIRPIEQMVRRRGETAHVNGIVEIDAEIGGEPRKIRNRVSVVWVRAGGQWQVLLWQSTGLAK